MTSPLLQRVLVTGGGGYVGSVLIPKLLAAGFGTTVLDLFLYGEEPLAEPAAHPDCELVKGDIRDEHLVQEALRGCDAVIHLACISNDPSFELDPALGRSINFDAFRPLVEMARSAGVKRFIYASSSSVYGVKEEPDVTEDLELEPLTDYSRFKADCEPILLAHDDPEFTPVILRPATVCGFSPRLRLDLTVNILTNHAVNNGRIRVFGGSQFRPNLHIDDMTDLYVELLRLDASQVRGRTWNVGVENQRVRDIADIVQGVVGVDRVEICTEPTDDLRSYRISSDRIRREIGFVPRRSLRDASGELVAAFAAGRIPNAMDDDRYYNVRRMQSCRLT